MDKSERKEVNNPRQNANPLSILTFWWILKLFVVGYKKELEEDDLYSPLREDKSSYLGQRIVKNWEREVKICEKKKDNSKPSLIRVLFKCFGKILINGGLGLFVLEFGIRIVQPFLLARILRYFSGNRQDWSTGIHYYAAAFCVVPLLDAVIIHWAIQTFTHLGMKVRVACCTLIYRKILRLSNSVLENETSVGQMINFLSNDVNRLDYFVIAIHYLWIGPLQVFVIAYLTFREIGLGAITGMIAFLLCIPLQIFLGRKVSRLTSVSAKKTDNRLRLMNQIINGVEVIKMYVWEVPYSLLVEKARRKEVDVIKKYSIVEQIGLTLDMYFPRVGLFIAILTYVLTGNNVDAEKVFMTTAFYTILRDSMTTGFAISVHQLAEALVSIRRLEKFMTYPEISVPQKVQNQVATQSVPIYLKNVTARWDNSRDNDTLQNIHLTVEAGSFIAVIGQIGSGKSSLLQVILRELSLTEGVLETNGKISFADQRPWIFASSIRQNILFGQSMNEARYNEVIRVCQLTRDIDLFTHKDRTMAGERGINLSGGQRARINLARALYTDADIYLLDDPLSAVDTHVGSRIVDECIHGFLKGKTIILVTHQIQYLKAADQIIVMNNGSIQAKGSFEELQSMNLDSMKVFEEIEDKEEFGEAETKIEKKRTMGETKKEDAVAEQEPVEVAETRSKGKMSSNVFFSYWKASRNIFLVLLMTIMFISSQSIASGSDYLVAFWVNTEMASWVRSDNGTMGFQWSGPLSRNEIIYIYSGLTMGIACIYVAQTFTYYAVCMRASKNLHAQMFRSIVRAVMYFYNTNPAGRILNRFSKDIGIIDKKMPFTMFDVIIMFLNFMGTIVILGTVSVWLLIPTCVIIVLFYYMRVVYISTSRAVKRMEGTTRSPVFDHVGATLQGLTTIRAFKAEKIVTTEFDNHQDLHTSTWFIFISLSRAFGLYIEAFCLIYIAVITIMFFVFEDLAIAGDIGLVITQVSAVVGILQWGIRQTGELENQMTSVERVLEYSKLEEEPFLDSIPEKKPPEEWPTKGLVEFRGVRLKYGPKSTCVLNGINFVIKPKEKVGVVGRTGAGKTSLISALFRLAYIEGEIIIDGIPTNEIALHDFRSKISIIPQEPVLFGGSLRRNLDPFDEYSDNVLWEALGEVEIRETISEMAAGLNSKVSEEGSNFSVGQRQLLCLVRALIRNNKIMVLDEATANVDPQTDSLIQQTVRKKFVDCTVITIAHRLNTIMDSDKILVMDQGCLVEYDHPYVLLQKKGYFYNMVQQTGAAMANSLSEVAKNCFYKNNEAVS
ncbi:probable multidrug resistance-associated protein lethal(2)03659 isoform X1 [Bombus vosnesenskii]|uniref:Probable multidrug resistance-associated protein lethal(2)03659 isoform X1 n=2 Tax=Bombus vosnesenskii TaxID=207650 RepID=A0A6J3K9E3_9HYME|nr:probable multidrug resistance-associated protein lethal(2)03659 isoform X1 [Bombus vosnesenskii]XP_033349716.1 probable multidrug resistance-associated protein lethal(2)03659 isoform X1 [Bombus vosnesenskii]XP_033349717.1 probable multidrug resistance-associated protein lethal(2)03659 isoform X1 [Bombus vosnesenskii]XP_033349718.1 probable multidrug resistance-associated protein lethal(2)03659 isoform X1 [Bombus vosnesenskii]